MSQSFHRRNLTPSYVQSFGFAGVISIALVAWGKCLGGNAMVPLDLYINRARCEYKVLRNRFRLRLDMR
jgi:hypothetical protein